MRILRNYSSSASSLGGLYILSAVRTPNGLLNGALSEFSAPQLGSFAIKEALQRAVVPPADVEGVFLECVSRGEDHEEVTKRSGLPKLANVSIFTSCCMKSLAEAVKFLVKNKGHVCIAGGMESITRSTNNPSYSDFFKSAQEDARKLIKSNLVSTEDRKKFVELEYNNFAAAIKNGAFLEEIIKIDFRKKGQNILVTEDEISTKEDLSVGELISSSPGDGAAAITITTQEYSKLNNLVPLAKVVAYTEVLREHDLASAQILAIEKALKLANCNSTNVARWEMASIFNDTVIKCKNYLNISSSQVNKDGGILSLGYPSGMSGLRAVCHLVHSLSPGEMGCTASCDFRSASAVIVQKLGINKSTKPKLTLFTKRLCPLCDELKEQLKPFKSRFSIKEVDIEDRGNEKYKQLYQNEIPVLFLDGIFLCKHKLDIGHFSRRLAASEEAT